MFAARYFPTDLSAEQLDELLKKGWFRIAQSIFTTSFLSFNNQIFSAVWLRVKLVDYEPEKKNKRLLQQNNRFHVSVGPARISGDHETLYRTYRKSLSFNASSSLTELLFGSASRNIYDTWQVDVIDETTDRLIASGFFDLGRNSAAGITSFYDPAYKKFSLGKFLILRKMQHCKDIGVELFYPGYFAPGYPLFDYKLTMGNASMEYYDLSSQSWNPIATFRHEFSPINVMIDKLTALKVALSSFNRELTFYKYEFFEANLYPELQGENLFDYPVFLLLQHHLINDSSDLIVFDVSKSVYRCVTCYSIWKSNMSEHTPDLYSRHLLKEEIENFVSSDINEMAAFITEGARRLEV